VTLAAILFAASSVAAARSITVVWDPNPAPDVRGHVVYAGSASDRIKGSPLTLAGVRRMVRTAVTAAGGQR